MVYTFQSETSDIVEVKKSKINKAGKGLFAKVNIKRGDHICMYFGVLVYKDQVHNGYYESDYLLEQVGHDYIIDAADPKSCLGRYANDSLSMKKSNTDFGYYKDPYGGYLKATKAIKKGEEIYISYGKDYWEDAKDKGSKSYTSLPKKDKDFINNEL